MSRLVVTVALAAVPDGAAQRTLPDYRYFRALSIDLIGRPPTRDELAAYEAPSFDLDVWLDAQLASPGYAERMRRIYEDVLRLEIGPSFQFVPNPLELRRERVLGPDGQSLDIYFRRGQRRVDAATDGEFCLTQAETGLQFPANAAPTGTAHAVDAKLLAAKHGRRQAVVAVRRRAPVDADRPRSRRTGARGSPASSSRRRCCSSPTARRRRPSSTCAARRRRPPRPAAVYASGRAGAEEGRAAAGRPA